MGILEELNRDEIWEEVLRYKLAKRHLSKREEREWESFVREKRYRQITEHLSEPDYQFRPPVRNRVNKSGTGRKRIVYTFSAEESMVLKAMGYLLYRYDKIFSDTCYSFRREISARDAIEKALAIPGLDKKYSVKVDIRDYFNSIPAPRLVEELDQVLVEDEPLRLFLRKLLLSDKAYDSGQLIEDRRGAMAGNPISPFFANLYLNSLDRIFEAKGVPYFRYSDDIMLFADTRQQLEGYFAEMKEHITKKGLSFNPEKVKFTEPGEAWEFLGFCYQNGEIELSAATMEKMKAKIRRKAHALYRWRQKKQADYERAAGAMIRTFNRKFYDEAEEGDFSWSRWFFPVLTSTEGLKCLDAYLVQYIRYLYSGRHYKGNYRITYEQIKEMGYRSLVHEYYRFRETRYFQQKD